MYKKEMIQFFYLNCNAERLEECRRKGRRGLLVEKQEMETQMDRARVEEEVREKLLPNILSTFFEVGSFYTENGKRFVEVHMLSKKQLDDMFKLIRSFRNDMEGNACLKHIMQGKCLAAFFYRDTHRTCYNYRRAMEALGGNVVYLDNRVMNGLCEAEATSVIRSFARSADLIVTKYIMPEIAVGPLQDLNIMKLFAGDGFKESPAQVILDLFIIHEFFEGALNGITITFAGDLLNRTHIHFMILLLGMFKVRVCYVPVPGMEIPDSTRAEAAKKGIIQRDFKTLHEAIPHSDVLYLTRLQRQYFDCMDDFDNARNNFAINAKIMRRAKKHMIVLHSLPSAAQINVDFVSDYRAVFNLQCQYGVYVCMAILFLAMQS